MYGWRKIESMEKRHVIKLTAKERKKLLGVVRQGKNRAAVIQRAHILLKSDEGKTDHEIGEMLYTSEQTVRRIRIKFCELGLAGALEDKPHPSPEPKLGEAQSAYLVALACSDPPAGQAKWTMELLAKRLVDDGIVERISPETVRLSLKKTNSNPGK
jgi:transposase